jgi:hypothetical protein
MHEKPFPRFSSALSTLAAITLKGSGYLFFEPNEPFTVSQALAGVKPITMRMCFVAV